MYKRSSLPSLKRLARHWTTIRDVLRFAVRRASDERIAQIAGSLTFTTVLSVVPLVTIVFAVLSALPVFAQMQEGLRNLLLQNLMPASVSDSIFRYLNQFVAKARGLTLVGVGFLAVTSVSTMLTIDGALNTIWRVRHPRPLYQRVLVYWAILTVGPILLALSLTLTSYLISTSAGLVNRPPPFISFLINFVPWVVLTFAYAGLYVYVPNRPVEWRDALIGGLIGASAFELAKRGFAIYIASFPSYTIIYGALAALPIFLLWVYVSWLITLAGATISAALPFLFDRRWNLAETRGNDFSDALRMVRILYVARAAPTPGLTVGQLARQSRIELEETSRLLESMEKEGIVIRLRVPANRSRGRRREEDVWIFAADATRVRLGQLFELFAFDGAKSATIGFSADDPLRTVVAATPRNTLDLTLAEIF
jgi:membrane protein